MADGDVNMLRIPITIDPDGLPDAALVKVATAKFPITAYDNVTMQIVRQPGLSSDKFVLVLTGRDDGT